MQRALVGGLGTMAAAVVTVGAVTMIAGWVIGICYGGHRALDARTPMALETVALGQPYTRLTIAANVPGLAPIDSPPSFLSRLVDDEAEVRAAFAPPATTDSADSSPALASKITDRVPADPDPIFTAALSPTPLGAAPMPLARPAERTTEVPLPTRRPADVAQSQATHQMAAVPPAPAAPALTKVAAIGPAPRPPTSVLFQNHASLPPPRNDALALPGRDSHTAIYDIAAHTVYLPSGERLEAHSGLGRALDDPRYIDERNRGATPPNVYDLKLREDLFHGVRAIRLNPVDDSKMHGRAGILAHTYMLGPSGQSFGCVSFRDYQTFLNAFLRGEVDRLVVVPHLQNAPTTEARARRDDGDWFNFSRR
jgi:hypothetical protein